MRTINICFGGIRTRSKNAHLTRDIYKHYSSDQQPSKLPNKIFGRIFPFIIWLRIWLRTYLFRPNENILKYILKNIPIISRGGIVKCSFYCVVMLVEGVSIESSIVCSSLICNIGWIYNLKYINFWSSLPLKGKSCLITLKKKFFFFT